MWGGRHYSAHHQSPQLPGLVCTRLTALISEGSLSSTPLFVTRLSTPSRWLLSVFQFLAIKILPPFEMLPKHCVHLSHPE